MEQGPGEGKAVTLYLACQASGNGRGGQRRGEPQKPKRLPAFNPQPPTLKCQG